jgi:hypothetical protein
VEAALSPHRGNPATTLKNEDFNELDFDKKIISSKCEVSLQMGHELKRRDAMPEAATEWLLRKVDLFA